MKGEWFKTCRPHLEWFNWAKTPDIEKYADQLIARAKTINSDTIVYSWESGGYLLYPGKLAPMCKNVKGQDLLGTLIKKAHANGLKFVICFLGQPGNTYVTTKHPDWVMQDSKGQLMDKWLGYNFRSLCPNSPHADYLYEITRELLTKYDIDGVYLEGVYMPEGFCYCPACKTFFKSTYGKDLPTENLKDDRHYQEFRQQSTARMFRLVKQAISEVKPETTFFSCIAASCWFGDAHADIERLVSPLADVISIEGQWNYDLPTTLPNPVITHPLPEHGLVTQIMKAESNKPVLTTVWIAKHVDQNCSPRSEANVTLNFIEPLAYGSLMQFHTQNAFEADSKLMPLVGKLNSDARQLRPYMLDSNMLSYASLVNWAAPNDARHYFDHALRGYYKSLIESHVPCRIISPGDIESGNPIDCSVVVLPNVLHLTGKTTDRLLQFVDGGGGLVMTYKTAEHNERLAAAAGITKIKGSSSYRTNKHPLHTYYAIGNNDATWAHVADHLLSFNGGLVDIRCGRDVLVIGSVLGLDASRKSREHIMDTCWPGKAVQPMITSRKFGKGTVVYIAADLDASAKRFGDQDSLDVLAAATRQAGQRPVPIKTNLPRSVELVTHAGRSSMAIVMVNQTTNQYSSEPIRYVVPISNVQIEVQLSTRKPKKVRLLSKRATAVNLSSGKLVVKFAQLREYEAVLVDF